jgi:S-adenosylmethionine hydrolase
MRVIALVTDFGSGDVYVGAMKAIIARIAPRARVIDFTHEIPPGDIEAGAFAVWQASRVLPAGAVILAVVDPGVGSARRPLALKIHRPAGTARTSGPARRADLFCVGPDNGLFTYALSAAASPGATLARTAAARASAITSPSFTAVEIAGPAAAGATFHGRDVFAPAAARLARGARIRALGSSIADPVRFEAPKLKLQGGSARGRIIHVDRFGNLITSIGLLRREGSRIRLDPWLASSPLPADAPTWTEKELGATLPGGKRIVMSRTYADVSRGEPLAYIGSDGLLEIGVNGGRADEALSLRLGDEVVLGAQAGHAPG